MKFNFGKIYVNGSPLTFFLKLSFFLFLFWMLLSGHFELKFILTGVLSACTVSYICLPYFSALGRTGEEYSILQLRIYKLLLYGGWLIKEIILSAIVVSMSVIKPKMDVKSDVIHFKALYNNPFATALLANSIILTPGTLTIDVLKDGTFVVHALTQWNIDLMLSGKIQQKVAWLFEEKSEEEK